MSNINYEQILVNEYWRFINHENQAKCYELINKSCRSKNHSDLEYIDKNTRILWRIEAKSHMSKDAYNAVHKIFGELLKETGRDTKRGQKVKYGILLDGRLCAEKKKCGKKFFKECFQHIDPKKYQKFGLLIPVEKIIVYDCEHNPCIFSWDHY